MSEKKVKLERRYLRLFTEDAHRIAVSRVLTHAKSACKDHHDVAALGRTMRSAIAKRPR